MFQDFSLERLPFHFSRPGSHARRKSNRNEPAIGGGTSQGPRFGQVHQRLPRSTRYRQKHKGFTGVGEGHEILVPEIVIRPSPRPVVVAPSCARAVARQKAAEKCFRTNWRALIDETTESFPRNRESSAGRFIVATAEVGKKERRRDREHRESERVQGIHEKRNDASPIMPISTVEQPNGGGGRTKLRRQEENKKRETKEKEEEKEVKEEEEEEDRGEMERKSRP